MDTELTNQEAQYEQAAPENPPVVESQTTPANPSDLAEAFAMLRNNDNATTQAPVEIGGTTQQPADSRERPEGIGDIGRVQEQPDIPQQLSDAVGGAPIDLSGFDANARAKEIYGGIRQQVIREKTAEWQEKGYKKFSVRDLARRDERTGKIFYVNPNDPPSEWERPGYQGIDINTAKSWVDITNEDLNNQWKQECSELEQKYLSQAMPYFNLLAYANTYNSLNETEKLFVDEMTEPYAIRNNSGDVIGFSCDLNKVTQIAKSMASRFASQMPQSQATNNVRQPATDARSSAGGVGKKGPREPKDLNDAFEILWEMER